MNSEVDRFELTCQQCGAVESYAQVLGERELVCTECRIANLVARVPDPEWEEIDRLIIANQKLPGIARLKCLVGARLHDALGMYASRYNMLRETRGCEFIDSDEDYWVGFIS